MAECGNIRYSAVDFFEGQPLVLDTWLPLFAQNLSGVTVTLYGYDVFVMGLEGVDQIMGIEGVPEGAMGLEQ